MEPIAYVIFGIFFLLLVTAIVAPRLTRSRES